MTRLFSQVFDRVKQPVSAAIEDAIRRQREGRSSLRTLIISKSSQMDSWFMVQLRHQVLAGRALGKRQCKQLERVVTKIVFLEQENPSMRRAWHSLCVCTLAWTRKTKD